jgi:hypothetical protein
VDCGLWVFSSSEACLAALDCVSRVKVAQSSSRTALEMSKPELEDSESESLRCLLPLLFEYQHSFHFSI